MLSVNSKIDTFFPRTSYQIICSTNKAITPLYLIALNQPLETIESTIDKHDEIEKRDKSRDWKNPLNGRKLTPLHLAVWRQNPRLVELLLEKNCNPATPDENGLLPIHYAEAFGNEEIASKLRQAMQAMKVDYVSHLALWNHLMTPPESVPGKTVFYHVDDKGSVQEGNADKFREIVGAQFHPTYYFSDRESLIVHLLDSLYFDSPSLVPKLTYSSPQIETIQSVVSPLCLVPQGQAGWGVKTTKKLRAFQPVVIYAGEISSEKSPTTSYTLRTVEAEKVRNLGSMINEGMPNCMFEEIKHVSGIRFTAIVPIRDIDADEPLFIDYGFGHKTKKGVREEFNLEQIYPLIRDFESFKNKVYQIHLSKTPPSEEELRNSDIYLVSHSLRYLFNTPTAMIALLFTRKLPAVQVQEMLEKLKSCKFYEHNYRDDPLQQMIAEAITFQALDQNESELLYEAFNETIRPCPIAIQYIVLSMGLRFVRDCHKQGVPVTAEGVGSFSDMVREALPAFLKTDEHLLNKTDISKHDIPLIENLDGCHKIIKKNFFELFHPSYISTEQYPILGRLIARGNRMHLREN